MEKRIVGLYMIGIHFVFYADDVLSFFIRIFVKEDKIKILCIKKILRFERSYSSKVMKNYTQ